MQTSTFLHGGLLALTFGMMSMASAGAAPTLPATQGPAPGDAGTNQPGVSQKLPPGVTSSLPYGASTNLPPGVSNTPRP